MFPGGEGAAEVLRGRHCRGNGTVGAWVLPLLQVWGHRGPAEPLSGDPGVTPPPAPPQSLPEPSATVPKIGGINLKQLIASERSHQRLNKHNLTAGMIIDLVKKGEKRKIELECIFEGKLEFNIITLRDETDYNYHVSEVEFLIGLFKIKAGSPPQVSGGVCRPRGWTCAAAPPGAAARSSFGCQGACPPSPLPSNAPSRGPALRPRGPTGLQESEPLADKRPPRLDYPESRSDRLGRNELFTAAKTLNSAPSRASRTALSLRGLELLSSSPSRRAPCCL